MENLKTFENPFFGKIRTTEKEGKILFCGNDVAKALGYKRTADAISAHCKGVREIPTPTNGGVQKVKFIPEGDVYRLICNSRLKAAEKFEHWVFDEVLPAIREQGVYGTPDIKEIIALTVSETVKQLLPYIIPNQATSTNHAPELENNMIFHSFMPAYKVETFPDEIKSIIDDTLALMEKQNNLNYSAIARWCISMGYSISSPAVKTYHTKRFCNRCL